MPNRNAQMLPLRACLATLAVLLFLPGLVAAQELTMEADAGFQSYYRPGKWSPVVVTLTNQPSEGDPGDETLTFRGRIALEYSSHAETPPGFRFVRDVEVPPFSTQRFVMFAKFIEPAGLNTNAQPPVPEVRLETRAGRLVTSRSLHITPLGKDEVLFVIVSEQATTLALPLPREATSVVQTVQVSPREMFDSWVGYDAADAIIFPGWPDEASGPRRLSALEDWTAMGGSLIMLGGANTPTYADRFIQALLPVALDGTEPVDIGDGQDAVTVLAAKSRPLSSAMVLESMPVGGVDTPILVQRDFGAGQVLFLAFDLSSGARPIRSMLSSAFLSVMPMPNILDWRHAVHDHLGKARLVTGAAARPPNLGIIILICVLYTALVGPVNFFLLMRRNKVQLAWVTVPAIVFVFAGLTYAIGAATKGGRDIARETTLLETVQGQRLANSLSYLSIFVSSSGEYEAAPVLEKIAIGDATRWTRIERVRDERWTTLGDASNLAFGGDLPVLRTVANRVLIDRWPLRTFDTTQFELRGPVEMDGPIDADVRFVIEDTSEQVLVDMRLTGPILNETGYDFLDSYVFLGGHYYQLGPMTNGQSIDLADHDLRFRVKNLSSPSEAGATWVRATGNTEGWRPIEDLEAGAFGDTDEAISRQNARRFLAGTFRPSPASDIVPPLDGGLYFVGVADRKDFGVTFGDLEPSVGSQALIVKARLFPEPPEGPFVLPPELVQMRLAEINLVNRFEVNTRRQGPPALEVSESTGMFIFETPFRSDRFRVTGLRQMFVHDDRETNAEFLANVYRFEDSRPAAWNNGFTPNPGDALATRRNGRGILRIAAEELDENDDRRRPGLGRGTTVEVERIGLLLEAEGG